MTTHEFDIEIGDYADGTLPRERQAAVQAHLAACERCRALAADFVTLRAAASGLERHSPPPHVWTHLAAGLAGRDRQVAGWRAWAVSPGWRQAAAAGVLLALITTGTWLAWRDAAGGPPAPADGTPSTGAAASYVSSSDLVQEAAAEMLRDEISQLEGQVDPDLLPGEAKAAFEHGFAEIDDVIVRADAVRQEEPYNELAQQGLFDALRSKLTLLQEMLALVNEMRKGNQEGTARIVSEMEP